MIVQVKSGHVKTAARCVIWWAPLTARRRRWALFITLGAPTADMQTAAVTAGFYHSPGWERDYPRIQILTISDLLSGAEVKMPRTATTF